MATVLRIDASARTTRSLSRALGDRFAAEWWKRHPDDEIIRRDVGTNPPPAISEAWIAAAFTREHERSPTQVQALALSDLLIGEVVRADLIVIATPMYNYGMPAALKAWVDQVIRLDATFTFDLGRGDFPLEPTLSGKPLVLLTSSGEFGFAPGGTRAGMDHLLPHVRTVAPYLGVDEVHHVAIEYQEFGDARHVRSVDRAHAAIPALVHRLAARVAGLAPAPMGAGATQMERRAS